MDTITKSHTSGRFSRSRLALLVTCQIAMLMGGAELANAAGYFNPALLEIDNPDQGSAIYPFSKRVSYSRREPIASIFISTVQRSIPGT